MTPAHLIAKSWKVRKCSVQRDYRFAKSQNEIKSATHTAIIDWKVYVCFASSASFVYFVGFNADLYAAEDREKETKYMYLGLCSPIPFVLILIV